MATANVDLTFTANASQVVAATNQINTALGATATKAETTAGKIGKGFEAADLKTSKLAKTLGPLGGVLARISPEAGAAASSIAGLTTAFEGAEAAGLAMETAVPVIAAIAIAISGAALLWQQYNGHVERAAAQAKKTADAMAVQAGYVTALDEANYHLKETVGSLTIQEEKLHARQEVSRQVAKDSIGLTFEQAEAIRKLGAETIYAKEQEIDYRHTKEESAQVLADRAADAAAAAAKAVDDEKKRAADEKAADEKTAAIMAEDAHRIELRDQHRMESAKRQLHDHLEEVAQIEERKKLEEEEDARREAAQRARIEREQSYLDAASSVAHAVATLADRQLQNQINALDTSTQAGKDAAKSLWETQQGLAVAMAVLDTARAISAASTLIPPASYVAMGVAAAIGAVNVAAIASSPAPKFHMGTNEVGATLTKDEAVLTGAAADRMGRDNIARLNSGRGGGGSVTVVQQVDHRVFHRTIRDNLALVGPLQQAVSKGAGSVGHRSSR